MRQTAAPEGGWGLAILLNAVVWAMTIIVASAVAAATDQFIYLIFTLGAGATLSGWAIEFGRRRQDRR